MGAASYEDVVRASPQLTADHLHPRGSDLLSARRSAVAQKRDPQEELRQAQLTSEAEVRAGVQVIADELSLGLDIVTALLEGAPHYCIQRLDQLQGAVMRLLASPVVGGGAGFRAIRAMADCCFPGAFQGDSIACAMRQMVQNVDAEAGGENVKEIVNTVHLMAKASATKLLPQGTFRVMFPLLRHVLGAASITPLTTEAYNVLSAHMAAGGELPRREILPLLFHMLELQGPGSTARLLPLVKSCCAGVDEADLTLVLNGLGSSAAHVRAAAIAGAMQVPCIEDLSVAPTTALTCQLFSATHDTDEGVKTAALNLWDHYDQELPADYASEMLAYLVSPSSSVRAAASTALTEAIRMHEDTLSATLNALMASFSACDMAAGRQAVAETLLKSVELLRARNLPAVSSFLSKCSGLECAW
ncbi:eIF-2-alpha kinase activator GCN1 [Cymbomonas tetramitiformis]|uniref:EIF-2-alpha kinase activator GCN1 n=1 Tax=Cymbomonas tetramitiformis TaxID=36881 RepID=A0AAE0GC58_9CHLO|nr:eIF-2-alpha kinase activator GCN1 [Cymbomonas tetramitiformis]